MVGAVRQHAPILSVASFRAWRASRPDEEHWELIEGVPMMMTPPNRRHQRIASNLDLVSQIGAGARLVLSPIKAHSPGATAPEEAPIPTRLARAWPRHFPT